jgi:hypothetical protein
LYALLAVASCASATGNDPDGGTRADARIRADSGIADASGVDADPAVPDAAPGPALLLISEVVDASLAGGLPKFVELTNIGGVSADLSGYSLGVYSNGGNSLLRDPSVVLSGSLAAGSSYVISFENSDSPGVGSFNSVYGVDPDNFDYSAQINGNDVIALFLADGTGAGGAATGQGSDATLVDIYGVIGAGGSPGGGVGEAWEYTDGFASRLPSVTAPNATFTAAEWQFSGPDALDGVDASGIAAMTSPGSH